MIFFVIVLQRYVFFLTFVSNCLQSKKIIDYAFINNTDY